MCVYVTAPVCMVEVIYFSEMRDVMVNGRMIDLTDNGSGLGRVRKPS